MSTVTCPNCGTVVAVPKSPTHQAIGKLGGTARGQRLSSERRQEIARLGGQAKAAKAKAVKDNGQG